jgi:hypothetical protein
MLPSAVPMSKDDTMLPTEKFTSHICRRQRSGSLLRNSIAAARKISAASKHEREIKTGRSRCEHWLAAEA